MIRTIVRQSTLLLLLGASAACYTYRPIRPAQIEPETRVRVTVSEEKGQDLAEVFRGPREQFLGRYVDGGENGDLLFEVRLQNPAPGMARSTLRNRVNVPPSHLVQLEARELSRWRTGLVAGGIVSAVTTAVIVVFTGEDDTVAEKRGEVDSARIPLFRWALPLGWRR